MSTRIIDPRTSILKVPGQRQRTERTPYYITDLPKALVDYLIERRRGFVEVFGRDYQDEDPQLWQVGPDGKPTDAYETGVFMARIANQMVRTNHHPAHCYAVATTHRIVYGCGGCIDDCPRCNFRYVPEGWSKQWKAAVMDYEKWKPDYEGLAPAKTFPRPQLIR